MPKSLRFAVVLKRYRLISAPWGNSKRFDSRRFSDFSRLEFFHEKQLQVLAPVSAACRTRPLSSFKDANVHLKKKTLQDCMATTHTGIHLFDSTCMLASCINCQTCSR